MPTIGTGRVQSQTGLVTFAQTATPASSVSSFTLQTPNVGINLFETFTNSGGNVVLALRSIVAGTGVKLLANRGVLYISLDTTFTADYATLDGRGMVPWGLLPTEVQTVPVAYVVPDRPPPGQTYNVVFPVPYVIPADFVGSVVYAGVSATNDAVFSLRRINQGNTTTIGTVTITPISHTSCSFSTQDSVTLLMGDVLQLVAPSIQDTTLADIGITILAAKI